MAELRGSIEGEASTRADGGEERTRAREAAIGRVNFIFDEDEWKRRG